MSNDRVTEIVSGHKLHELIFKAIFNTTREVTDGWGILTDNEKDRVLGIARFQAEEIEKEIGARLDKMFDQFIADNRDYFVGIEKGYAVDGEVFTIKLSARRSDIPLSVFAHRNNFMIVLTDGQMTLDELNRQGDVFKGKSQAGELADSLRDESGKPAPLVAQFMASQAAADSVDTWVDAFVLALGAMGAGAKAAAYGKDGPLDGLPLLYFDCGWSPVEAAENETRPELDRRIISDGPEPQAGNEAA